MSRRLLTDLELLIKALCARAGARRRARPRAPGRILVVPTLFSGDAMFLAPLFAKLRHIYPQASISVAVGRNALPLFSANPYGIKAFAHDPRRPDCARALALWGTPDLALVLGDNRLGLLPAALGAHWIVGFAGEPSRYKDLFFDELKPMPTRVMAWGDMAATLLDGNDPPAYRQGDWSAPTFAPFERPAGRYAVFHVEASTPLKHWEPAKWRQLAERLVEDGLDIVWSAGREGDAMLAEIDPHGRHQRLGHRLDLAQLWHLVADAALLVCPDTSVMHIGRLVATPTVALFGPSDVSLFGPGDFLRGIPYRAITVPDFPCRDQNRLFKREIAWVRRCQRSTAQCAGPRCMQAIGVDEVADAARALAR